MTAASDLLAVVRNIKLDDPTALSKLMGAVALLLEMADSGGDIPDGSITTAKLAALAVTDAKVAAANKDGTATTPSLRTLGTAAGQAAVGADFNKAGFRSVTNASDTVATTDLILQCNRSGAIALSLPALGSPGSGKVWLILVQDVSGAAGTNNITITPATTINGAGTYVINTNYGAISLRSTDGSVWTAA